MDDEYRTFDECLKVLIDMGLLPQDPKVNRPILYHECVVRYMQNRGDKMKPWEYLQFADVLTPGELVQAEELNRMAVERHKD